MVNKYDVFINIAKKGSLSLKELNFSNKLHFIKQLVNENLIIKTGKIVSVTNNSKSKKLFSILMFCLNNDLNYVFYTQKSTLTFLYEYFNDKQSSLSRNTLTKIMQTLDKDSFLVYFSKKPIKFVVLNHTFFKELFCYFGFVYREKSLLERDILEKLNKIRVKREIKEKTLFIHSSLQLEGNLLTLRQTQKILKNDLIRDEINPKDVLETINYDNGLKHLENLKNLDLENVLYLHSLIMNHEDFAGRFREEDVIIKGNPSFKICSYKNIISELDKLLDHINSFLFDDLFDFCKKIAYVHNQFQYIHPFLDGNSRLTRLITYFLFIKSKVGFDIPLGFSSLYLKATKGYKKRNDKELAFIFALIIIKLSQIK